MKCHISSISLVIPPDKTGFSECGGSVPRGAKSHIPICRLLKTSPGVSGFLLVRHGIERGATHPVLQDSCTQTVLEARCQRPNLGIRIAQGLYGNGCLAEPRSRGPGARRSDRLQAYPDLLSHQPSVREF